VEVVASLSQGRTAAAQCGFFTYKSVPVIFDHLVYSSIILSIKRALSVMMADQRDMFKQASRRVYTDHYVISRLPDSIKFFFISITAVNTFL